MQAILEHTTTKFRQYIPEIRVLSTDSMYLTIELNTEKYQDGDYRIMIFEDNNNVVGSDIIRIGSYKNTKTQYKVEKKFTQYVRGK